MTTHGLEEPAGLLQPKANEASGGPALPTAGQTAGQKPADLLRASIAALGDPAHPQHAHAVADLIAHGRAAVPALVAALRAEHPWLTAYRAAEALAQIGDGRATSALVRALHHPNSNVRWSAVRALAQIDGPSTRRALRRVAQADGAKTTWGESVAETAQQALDQMQARSAVRRLLEPVMTALCVVAMLIAVLFAEARVQTVRTELGKVVPVPTAVAVRRSVPTVTPESQAAARRPVVAASPSTGTVLAALANVHSAPGPENQVIGLVHAGDSLVFLSRRGDWFLVRLEESRSPDSSLPGGAGWISRMAVSTPTQAVPATSGISLP
jgi:hypothetical protein